jgi:geranylgeranyl reductase family protein
MTTAAQPGAAGGPTGVWDVVVVGAGPAGCVAALTAASAGARTLILERGDHPRYKTCGGGLIGPSLANLPPGLDLPVRQEVREALITYRGRAATRARDARLLLPLVDRFDFDAALLAAAECAGATVRRHAPVKRLRDCADHVVLEAGGGSVTARAVVGADGTSGQVGRHVGVELDEIDVGLEAEIPLPESQRARWADTVLLDWGELRGSYGWVFPKGDRLTVGVIADRSAGTAARAELSRFLVRLGLDDIPGTTSSGHLTRCRTPASPLSRGRVLVAGDAAGLLEPWSREGISFALRSGRAAGTAASKIATAADDRDAAAAASGYTAAIEATLAPEMAAGRQLREVQSRHPRLLQAIFSLPGGHRLFADVVTGRTTLTAVMAHRSARTAAWILGRV